MSVKLCKDCGHYQGMNCLHPDNVRLSPVDGLVKAIVSAEYMREKKDKCSEEARWFVRKAT